MGTWITFTSGIAACLVPFCLSKNRYLTAAALVVGIFLAKGLTGVIVAGVGVSLWAVFNRDFKLLFMTLTLGASSLLFANEAHMNHSRMPIWENYMDWWWTNANHFLGAGAGSFEIVGAKNGMALDGDKLATFRMLHNDYLQILFEYGYIGLALFVILCGWILWRLKNKPAQLSTACGMGVFMTSYFPLHFFCSQLIMLYLLTEAINADADV